MKIFAKKGFEIELAITGQTREFPFLKISFEFGGKTIKNARVELEKMERLNQYRIYLPEQNGRVEIEKAEYEKIISAINELPKETTREIDADGDIIVIEIKKDEPKAEPKTSTKRGIENIMFDNESEGIDRFNGISVDKFAMIGIENVEVKASTKPSKESQIEELTAEISEMMTDETLEIKSGKLGDAIVDLLELYSPNEKPIETDYGFRAGSIVIDHEGINDIETGETIQRGWWHRLEYEGKQTTGHKEEIKMNAEEQRQNEHKEDVCRTCHEDDCGGTFSLCVYWNERTPEICDRRFEEALTEVSK